MNPENLNSERNEIRRLQKALRLNQPLATAYYMKEELRELWEQEDSEAAQAHLMDWIIQAEASGIRMLKQFAKTLRLHAFGYTGLLRLSNINRALLKERITRSRP